MDLFDHLIDRVLPRTAQYRASENNPGAESKWGLLKKDFLGVNLRVATRADAKALCKTEWRGLHLDMLPPPMALQAMHAALYPGRLLAIQWIQIAAGTAPDGAIGQVTLTALQNKDPVQMTLEFCALRLLFYTDLSNFHEDGRTWVRRMARSLQVTEDWEPVEDAPESMVAVEAGDAWRQTESGLTRSGA